MNLDMASIVRWMEILVSVSCLVQTLEYWKIKNTFGPKGVWRWSDLKQEFHAQPVLEKFLGIFLEDSRFLLVLVIRFFCCLLLLIHSQPLAVLVLLLTSLFISLRWRGTFNGGSDYMTFLVLAMLTLIRFFPGSPNVISGCLWYLALQTLLSYFISGWIKIKNANWRSGSALSEILRNSNYEVPLKVQNLAQDRKKTTVASWLVIIFECSFPLALLNPSICLAYLTAAFLFHIGNSYVLGLNRFLYAWLAAYPAVYFCSLQVLLN